MGLAWAGLAEGGMLGAPNLLCEADLAEFGDGMVAEGSVYVATGGVADVKVSSAVVHLFCGHGGALGVQARELLGASNL